MKDKVYFEKKSYFFKNKHVKVYKYKYLLKFTKLIIYHYSFFVMNCYI